MDGWIKVVKSELHCRFAYYSALCNKQINSKTLDYQNTQELEHKLGTVILFLQISKSIKKDHLHHKTYRKLS
jgi:hypothetical protein